MTPHGRKTEVISIFARLIHGRIAAQRQRVILICSLMTSLHMFATFRETINGELILGFIDRLDTIGIVIRKLRISWHLREDVDAGIDQTHRFQVQGNRKALFDASIFYATVLCVEEVGEGWAVMSTIAFRPNAEFVVLWFVLGKPCVELDMTMQTAWTASPTYGRRSGSYILVYPNLHEMPRRQSRRRRCACCIGDVLTGEDPINVSGVQLWSAFSCIEGCHQEW